MTGAEDRLPLRATSWQRDGERLFSIERRLDTPEQVGRLVRTACVRDDGGMKCVRR
jgi:hypothetical protein